MGFSAVTEEFGHQARARHGVPLVADAARVEGQARHFQRNV